MTVPGLAPHVSSELQSRFSVRASGSGYDGRSDVVLFNATREGRRDALQLRTAEDVFVELGRTLRSDGDKPHWIAGRIWRPERVERALSTWAEQVRPLGRAMTYRVIVRVLQEKSFLRTELRREFIRAIARDRPRWKTADPAQVEIWVCEYAPGKIVTGLRLSTASMRQHGGRAAERSGALRPAVAAAMVRLAGAPGGVLLDPCCGSGTILHEALIEGWQPRGLDIDSDAVATARRNVPDAAIDQGDALSLAIPKASARACVSNLPFGAQYKIKGDPEEWVRGVLGEMTRVTQPGGRVIVLVPNVARDSVPATLTPAGRTPIRLLGQPTTIWAYET